MKGLITFDVTNRYIGLGLGWTDPKERDKHIALIILCLVIKLRVAKGNMSDTI